jgi:hypothetical protein
VLPFSKSHVSELEALRSAEFYPTTERPIDKPNNPGLSSPHPINTTTTMPKTRSKTSARPVPPRPQKTNKGRITRLPASLSVRTAPVSIGTTVQAVKPIVKKVPNGVVVRGREFLCAVFATNNADFQLAACAPLHPMYYPASTMGTLARAYQKYRFINVAVHFVTRQPTSVTGEIAIVYSSQITEPAESGTNANFLARVMTRGKAILGPLWQNHSIEVVCDSEFRLIDPFIQPDIAKHINGELQCYVQSDVDGTAGYLLIDYDLEFQTTMFTPHSQYLPLTTGAGQSFLLTDSSATPTAADAVQVTNTTITASPNGTVWKFYVNADESVPATGTTTSNAWNTCASRHSTTTTVTLSTINTVLGEGMVIYGVVIGTSLFIMQH